MLSGKVVYPARTGVSRMGSPSLPLAIESGRSSPEPQKQDLPLIQYSQSYQEIESKRMNQNEKNALFEKIGNVVAIYNFYTKNQRLCTLNSSRNKKRIVYTKNVGIEYHLSLDFESGGFEVFDKNYVHMGQYNFSCAIAKKAQPKSHILIH